ncbi:hypothetical protein [Simplicispira psychrophila]|uniref:hypothetical protein n=1 Tax=Simplicispira psychrophila TaxID=80882 RepID=UPI0012EC467E|nr:hypothetical protein [Simplicispira psychrophila]
MSLPNASAAPAAAPPFADAQLPDAVEAVVPYIPLVIPAVGAVMIFLLAMIAVYMA